jgi:acetyl-CoA carboxylase biotin carboxyl carrier protein
LSLTAKDVAEIMRLLEDSNFDSLSLEMDGVKLHLQRRGAKEALCPAEPARADAKPAQTVASPATRKPRAAPPSEPGVAEVTSPLLGIFYRAPRPGQPPFVEVGSAVEENTVIGIIEVMKLMNSVRAGVKGEVVEILSENGTLVEYGEVLLRVRPKV